MKASVFLCVLKKYPVMIYGDHEGKCVFCDLKMHPVMVSGDHECKSVCVCVEEIANYGIW